MWFRDEQGEIPIGHCGICGSELYEGEYEHYDEDGCRICSTCAAEMEVDECF